MRESKIKVPSGSGCGESSLAIDGHLLTVPSHGGERAGCFSLPLHFFFFHFQFCIGVFLTNNAVIVSGGQPRDPAIHTYVSILPKLLSHPGCCITLSRVPCAIQ